MNESHRDDSVGSRTIPEVRTVIALTEFPPPIPDDADDDAFAAFDDDTQEITAPLYAETKEVLRSEGGRAIAPVFSDQLEAWLEQELAPQGACYARDLPPISYDVESPTLRFDRISCPDEELQGPGKVASSQARRERKHAAPSASSLPAHLMIALR